MHVTMQGTPYTLAVGPLLSPLGIPCTAPPWGKLVALDLAQGRVAWEAPLGSVHEMGPLPLPWHINWGTPNLGCGLVTDGGVFFIGATMDRQFRAFDVRDGRQLWSYELPIDATATPMMGHDRNTSNPDAPSTAIRTVPRPGYTPQVDDPYAAPDRQPFRGARSSTPQP